MLTYGIVTGVERMSMPVLFPEIAISLNLNITSLGTIWGMDPLAGIFVGLIGGLLADRFGIQRSLTVICILAGIFSALRGLSTNFLTMSASMFLFGVMAAMMPSIVPKAAAIWFNGKQVGLVNAFINIALSVGSMVATMTSATILSPWLDGWRNVVFLLGVPSIIIGLLWLFTGREPRKDEVSSVLVAQVPFKQALLTVIRVKEVWVIGFISLSLWGGLMGVSGYLPTYLRDIGWTPVAADTAITVYNGASMVGSIPMVILANRIRSYKGMFFFSMVVTFLGFGLTPLVDGTALWLTLIISSFLRSATPAFTNVILLELDGIGIKYSGTALGLVSSLGMVGGFLAPPLGNSLAGINPGWPFYFWAILSLASLPLFMFLKLNKKNAVMVIESKYQT